MPKCQETAPYDRRGESLAHPWLTVAV